MSTQQRTCPVCGDHYMARTADLKRGWAKSCSKSCAAIARTRRERKGNYQIAAGSAKYSTRNDPRVFEREFERDMNRFDHEGGGWDDYKRA